MPINTVGELRKLIKGLPNDMPFLINDEESGLAMPVCETDSGVVTVDIIDEETGEPDGEAEMLILFPCYCNVNPELEIGEINSQPELN